MAGDRPKRNWRRWFAISFLAASVGSLVADYWLYPALVGVGGRSRDKGENGLWLRYTWYFGRHANREVAELAKRMTDRHIRYAYFHVRSIEGDGTLKYHYPDRARRLTNAIRASGGGVESVAWVYAGNASGRGKVDLADREVRKNMVREALWLATACGFDGVQWDYEICPSGDLGFLQLLEETRSALPKGKILSVAAECSYPTPLARFGWSDDYIAEVARRCDQLAVMCYDSGMFMPRSYVWFTGRQASLIPRIAKRANPGCEVLLGLPTYGQGNPSHNQRAESLRLALKAVRETDASPGLDGVAIFADYTTDDAAWREYESLWERAGR